MVWTEPRRRWSQRLSLDRHGSHPHLNGEDSWTHREKFRELSLQEHLQLPLAELEPVSFPAGVAVKGSNYDVHGNLQLGGHAGSRGEHSRVSHQSRGENACEG